MDTLSIAHKKIIRVTGGTASEIDDDVAIEEPVEIILNHGPRNQRSEQVVSITMRTPGNDQELALGFLFTENIISSQTQVRETMVVSDQNKVLVILDEEAVPVLHKAERNFYTTSSCGVCGKTSIAAINVLTQSKYDGDSFCIQPATFYQLGAELRARQDVFKITGGLHAAALFDLEGNFDYLREDVGRHNALDKVIGAAFLRDALPLNNRILLLSGRASFELIQKAVMAGIRVVAAVGAPSSLAVDLARESGITLVGFLRGQGFNVYSGHHRIQLDA